MFIYLDDSLLIGEADPSSLDIKRAVRNLTNAAFESKHILYGDLRVIEVMRNQFKSEPDLYRVLDKIYQKYSTFDCPPEITYYIKVSIEDGPVETDDNGKQFSKVSYSHFTDSESSQACNLVSEDFYDCEFYRIILDKYRRDNRINLRYNFNDCSGAGENTHKYLRNFLKKKQITLCIVDSDKKYKDHRIQPGSTCSKCAAIGSNTSTYHLEILDVQEVENLVPLNVVDELTWTANSIIQKESFDYLRNNAKTESLLPYFDIKGGIKKDNLFKSDEKYRDYAKNCYYLNPKLFEHGDFDQYVDSLSDDDVIYPHLQKGLLKNFLDYRKTHPSCDMELLEFQLVTWNVIGQLMLNMGCCRNFEALS